MPQPNFANRTLWTGDNLDIMRGMNDDCIDLIYLDPPFNSNRNYEAPIGGIAEGAAFKDRWTVDMAKEVWHGEIASLSAKDKPYYVDGETLYDIIRVAGRAHGTQMKGYLIWMAVRLLEMKRILKPTGSIYLHCDDSAGTYIKMLMDGIFGASNCANEIQWRRTKGKSNAHKFGRVHDNIFYYRMSSEFTWNTQYTEHDPAYIKKNYRNQDERGLWRSDQLTAPYGGGGGSSTDPWRGIDPVKEFGRAWCAPTRGGMSNWIIQNNIIPNWPDAYPTVQNKLDALDSAGLVQWPKNGRMPSLKRYLASTKGNACDDMIVDIGKVESNSRENVDYPTQKPIKLLQRLINSASNPGDIVLDPFCGCATACVAAEDNSRHWVGIDISPLAHTLVNHRLSTELNFMGEVHHREDIPLRTDLGDIKRYNDPDNKKFLYGQQEGICKGCKVLFPYRNMTIDHIIPQNKGGSDHIDNLQLLCGACNSKKGKDTMEALIVMLTEEGVI